MSDSHFEIAAGRARDRQTVDGRTRQFLAPTCLNSGLPQPRSAIACIARIARIAHTTPVLALRLQASRPIICRGRSQGAPRPFKTKERKTDNNKGIAGDACEWSSPGTDSRVPPRPIQRAVKQRTSWSAPGPVLGRWTSRAV